MGHKHTRDRMLIIKYESSECVPWDRRHLVGEWVLHGLVEGLDNPLEWYILLSPHSGLLELKSFLVFGSHIYIYSQSWGSFISPLCVCRNLS